MALAPHCQHPRGPHHPDREDTPLHQTQLLAEREGWLHLAAWDRSPLWGYLCPQGPTGGQRAALAWTTWLLLQTLTRGFHTAPSPI